MGLYEIPMVIAFYRSYIQWILSPFASRGFRRPPASGCRSPARCRRTARSCRPWRATAARWSQRCSGSWPSRSSRRWRSRLERNCGRWGYCWWEKAWRNNGKPGENKGKGWKASEIWKMWKVLPDKPGRNMLNYILLEGHWAWWVHQLEGKILRSFLIVRT